MAHQAVQDVVRVLPHRLGHNQRGVRVDVRAEDGHSLLLRADEAVVFVRLEGVSAHQLVPGFGDGGGE